MLAKISRICTLVVHRKTQRNNNRLGLMLAKILRICMLVIQSDMGTVLSPRRERRPRREPTLDLDRGPRNDLLFEQSKGFAHRSATGLKRSGDLYFYEPLAFLDFAFTYS